MPNDPQSPFVTSVIRLGTPAITTRGFKENETKILGNLICDVLDGISYNNGNKNIEEITRQKIKKLCEMLKLVWFL